MKRVILGLVMSLWASVASANVPCSLAFTLTNGTTADATQVMANYNAIIACLANSTAASGANSDITSLTGLTSPTPNFYGNFPNVLTTLPNATYTILPADCGKQLFAGTGTTGFYTLLLQAPSNYSTSCLINIKNGDVYTGSCTGRGKALSGFPSDAGSILWPLQNITIGIVNGAWQVLYNPKRWKAPPVASLVMNIDTSGSATNDGLCTGATGAIPTLQGGATVIYYAWDTQGNQPVMSVACSQTHNEQLFLGGQLLGNNAMTLQPACSGGGSFTMTSSSVCISVGDNAELVFLQNGSGGINFICNTSNTVGQGAIVLHNNGIVDLFTAVINFTGGGSNDSAIFIDGPGILASSNGFNLIGTFGDAVHFDHGGTASLSGVIAPVSAPTVARLFNLTARSFLTMGTAPTGAGYGSLGPSLVSGNSVLITNGVTIPGGAITPTSGGQVCVTKC